ncbi:uncharacterized protein [Penaeus vannamei]|uniref:uncharacterized protein n=1 Tax=Penaeus vannamei TaxID=6689 RepID=UPI00387F4E19
MKTAERRLAIGRNQMYAIKKPDAEVTYNKNGIIRVVEDFYRDLYNSNEELRIEANPVTRDVPNITIEDIQRSLKDMERGRTPGEDGISIDHILDAGEIASMKLTNIFIKCILNGTKL